MAFPTIRQQKAGQSSSTFPAPDATTVALDSAAASGNQLVLCFAGDKNTGALTVTDNVGDNGGQNPWQVTAPDGVTLTGTSVSLYIARKTAVGGEATITATTGNQSGGGNTCLALELEQDGTGDWLVVASAVPAYSDSSRASAGSGTSDTADFDGLGIAVGVIDSMSSIGDGETFADDPTFSNGYVKPGGYNPTWPPGSGGGSGGCYVGVKDVAEGTTTSTTFATNGGSDQLSCAILVIGREDSVVIVEKPAGDAATGTDSASVGITVYQDGLDAATGTDSAITGIPQPGADAATTGESASTDAELYLHDARAGVEDVFIDAALDAGTDSATTADAGQIIIPAEDSAGTGHDHHIDAELYLHDPAAGREGVSIETLYGDLVVSIFGIDPVTDELVALPDFTDLSISPERNGWGSIRLDYPVAGQNFDLLRQQVTDSRDLQVEIWSIGSPLGALRGYLQEASGDDTAETSIWTFAGAFLETRMTEAVVWPQPVVDPPPDAADAAALIRDRMQDGDPINEDWTWDGAPAVVTAYNDALLAAWEADDSPEPVQWLGDFIAEHQDAGNEKRELLFGAATPGEVVEFIMIQAQGRGALAGIGWDFTDTHDSAGNPWPNVITTKFSPGARYDQILNKLVDLGLIEWAVEWTGTKQLLRLWVPEGRGFDLTTGPRPVVLRHGRNLIDAPHKWSVREAGTALLGAGAEGVYDDVSDASAEARRGRRIEHFVSANNLEDEGAVEAFLQQQLRITTQGLREITHGIGFLPGEARPIIAFNVGDWVYSQTRTTLDRLRIVQWTLTINARREMSGTVTLNDTATDTLVRLQAAMNALTAGETVVGTSVSSDLRDTVAPGPPTGLVADSIAYREDVTGDVYAAVTLGWLAPEANVDGTAVTDIDRYRIRYKPGGTPVVDPNGNPLGPDDSWSVLGAEPTASPYTFSGVASDIDIDIQVAAIDRDGNQGPYSAALIHHTAVDDVPPPAPSTPEVYDWFGTLRILWDGRDTDGADMLEAASDFWRADVHVSQADEFTPDDTTFVASIYGAGPWNVTDLPIGVTHYVRLIAYDRAGNASPPSGIGFATPRGIAYPDMGPDAVGSAQIRDLAVLTAHIGDAQIVDLKVNTVSVGKLVSGTMTADVLLSGNIRTANSGTRTEMDGAGIRLYNGSTLTVDLSTVTGNALITGEYRTAFNGARLVFNAGGSHRDEIWFYPSSGNQYAVLATHNHMGEVMQAAINMRGNSTRSDGYTGHVGAWPPEAYIKWGGLQAESVSAISCGRLASTWWAPSLHLEVDHRNSNDGFERRIEFRHRDDDGDIRNSSRLYYLESRASTEEPMLYGPNMGVGLTWAYGSLYVGDLNGSPREIGASNTDPSSRTIKRDERPITFTGGLSALDVVTSIESKAWNYIGDEPDEKPRYGPMAEDVLALVPELVRPRPSFPGGMVIGTSDKIGVLWQALAELAAEVKRLKAR